MADNDAVERLIPSLCMALIARMLSAELAPPRRPHQGLLCKDASIDLEGVLLFKEFVPRENILSVMGNSVSSRKTWMNACEQFALNSIAECAFSKNRNRRVGRVVNVRTSSNEGLARSILL